MKHIKSLCKTSLVLQNLEFFGMTMKSLCFLVEASGGREVTSRGKIGGRISVEESSQCKSQQTSNYSVLFHVRCHATSSPGILYYPGLVNRPCR